MSDLRGWEPDNGWDAEQWTKEAKAVREALATIGVIVPHCLPGEPEDCGEAPWAHYASYAALLKANAQLMIEVNLAKGPDNSVVQHFGELVYEDEVNRLRRDFDVDG